MKKLFFFVTLFCLLLNAFAVFAQSCDCEALQAEIDKLREQLELFQANSYDSDDNTSDYLDVVYIDKDYEIRYIPATSFIKISNLRYDYNAKTGKSSWVPVDYSTIYINLLFRNNSPFETKISDKIFFRAYQNNNKLTTNPQFETTYKKVAKKGQDFFTIGFILNNDTDDIVLEVYELLSNNQLNHITTWIVPMSDAVRE